MEIVTTRDVCKRNWEAAGKTFFSFDRIEKCFNSDVPLRSYVASRIDPATQDIYNVRHESPSDIWLSRADISLPYTLGCFSC